MDLTGLIEKKNKAGTLYYEDVNDIIVAKQCRGNCGDILPLEGFNNRSDGLGGKDSLCRTCARNRGKNSYKKDKERIKEKSRKYYEDNKEERKQNMREYGKENRKKNNERFRNWAKKNRDKRHEITKKSYEKHRAEKLEYSRKYREENPELTKERQRLWRVNNPEKARTIYHNRKALEKNLPATMTAELDELLLKEQGYKCLSGATITPNTATLDHVIPITWGQGGTTPENSLYLTFSVNSSKQDRNVFNWLELQPQTTQERFYTIFLPMIAERNGLTVDEYRDFVYWCEANKRTAEEVEADNIKYGEKKPSIELWKESVMAEV
jgi:hypothetical protein